MLAFRTFMRHVLIHALIVDTILSYVYLLCVDAHVLLSACASDPSTPEGRYEAYLEQQEQKHEQVEDQLDELPDWYMKPPTSDHAVYSVGSGRSTSLDMAVTKATLTAKRYLADRIAGELTEKIREFSTEIGNADSPVVMQELERATANVIRRVPVHGYRITEKVIQAQEGNFQVYVLLEYGDEQINRVLQRSLERERLRTKDKRKKELYQQLERELERGA